MRPHRSVPGASENHPLQIGVLPTSQGRSPAMSDRAPSPLGHALRPAAHQHGLRGRKPSLPLPARTHHVGTSWGACTRASPTCRTKQRYRPYDARSLTLRDSLGTFTAAGIQNPPLWLHLLLPNRRPAIQRTGNPGTKLLESRGPQTNVVACSSEQRRDECRRALEDRSAFCQLC